MFAHDREQKRLFVFGVIIDGAHLHPDIRCQLTHGDGRIPMSREQTLGALTHKCSGIL
jgi:hypothetical protein